MAIKHLAAALTVFSRESFPQQWAEAQNNLAIAYQASKSGDGEKNREQAIAGFDAALTIFTREATPQDWAQAMQNLGQAYAGRRLGNRADNRQKAVASFEAALTVFTPDAAPLDHLRTSRLLGRVFFEAGDWRRAAPAYASARRAFSLLFEQGVSDGDRRALIADAGTLFAEAAFGAIQRGETELAFEIADEGRARLLSVALKLQALDLPPQSRRRLEELRADLRQAQEGADAAFGTERVAAIERLAAARRDLKALVGTSARSGESSLTEARRLASGGAAVVMPVVTDLGGKLLVLTGSRPGADLAVVHVPNLTTKSLASLLVGSGADDHGWIGAYFANYVPMVETDSRWAQWLAAIDHMGPKLWELFGAKLDALLQARGVKRDARLVWLPPGWLGILPLGLTQEPASGRRFADTYEIVYAPSLAALAATNDAGEKQRHATLAAAVNPTGDLPGTEREGALVASYFQASDRVVLEGRAATADAVMDSLKGKTHWHFASHGSFSWLDARNSGLVMHGAELLTVGRLLDAPALGRPRLVVLSACETGLSDIRSSPDEFIGLPGTFTALGAAGVVGTLWPVSDAATALLMAKFYELHLGVGVDPPTALRQAQSWLRHATNGDLNGYATVATRSGRLAGQHLATIEHELRFTPIEKEPGVPSNAAGVTAKARFAHPYYWAGFIYTGQ
jgi:CHAT domain-containing protein